MYRLMHFIFILATSSALGMASDTILPAITEEKTLSSDESNLCMICFLAAEYKGETPEDKELKAKWLQVTVNYEKLHQAVERMHDEIQKKAQESPEFKTYIKEWMRRNEEADEDLNASTLLAQELLSTLQPNNISWIHEVHE